MLDGSIAQIGSTYNLVLNAVNCATGEMLATAQAEALDKNQVLGALGKVASDIRGKLGESLAWIQKFNTPIEKATTSSLEALKAYSGGMLARRDKGDEIATPFFKQAIDLDPNFAIAYAELGQVNFNLGESRYCPPRVYAESLRSPRPRQRTGTLLHRVSLLRQRRRRPAKVGSGI